jgi:hypothetical protein
MTNCEDRHGPGHRCPLCPSKRPTAGRPPLSDEETTYRKTVRVTATMHDRIEAHRATMSGKASFADAARSLIDAALDAKGLP